MLYMQPTHNIGGKTQLLSLIKGHVDGIAVADLKDAYPTVMQDLQVYIHTRMYACICDQS